MSDRSYKEFRSELNLRGILPSLGKVRKRRHIWDAHVKKVFNFTDVLGTCFFFSVYCHGI